MYKIREAKAMDYQTFLPLYRECMQSRQGEYPVRELKYEEYEKLVSNPGVKFYFVEKEQELQAFTLFYPQITNFYLQPAGKPVLHIEELYVKSAEERKGIDQHLFQKIEKYGRRNGVERIELELPVRQKEKIAYYEERLKLSPVNIVLTHNL